MKKKKMKIKKSPYMEMLSSAPVKGLSSEMPTKTKSMKKSGSIFAR